MPVYKNAYLEKKINLSTGTGTCYGKRSVKNDVLVVREACHRDGAYNEKRPIMSEACYE